MCATVVDTSKREKWVFSENGVLLSPVSIVPHRQVASACLLSLFSETSYACISTFLILQIVNIMLTVLLKKKTFSFVLGYAQLTNDVVMVSGDQGRGVQPFSPKPHAHPGCQSAEQSFLCCTEDPCWLSILIIALCTCLSQTP